MLQLVIKMSIFDKINDALIIDIFKNVFQSRAVSVSCECPEGQDNTQV